MSVKIDVLDPDPQMAADIANDIASLVTIKALNPGGRRNDNPLICAKCAVTRFD